MEPVSDYYHSVHSLLEEADGPKKSSQDWGRQGQLNLEFHIFSVFVENETHRAFLN